MIGTSVRTHVSTPSRLAAIAFGAALVVSDAAVAQESSGTFTHRPATHSHNDYYRNRPLLDALDNGMVSIEADLYAVELPFTDDEGTARALRELYVAHDWEEIEGNVPGFARTKGTFAELYLDPLWEIWRRQDGVVYPDATLLLHADMKTATERTWPVLEATLRNYPGLFTSYDLETGEVVEGPVTVYTNAEPDAEFLAEHGVVHSTADGRFGDIFDAATWQEEAYTARAWRMPIVSSNLQAYMDVEQMFELKAPEADIVAAHVADYPALESEGLYATLGQYGWQLANELLESDEIAVADYLPERLAEVDALGREKGHLMRFWASPDEAWFWRIVGPLDHVVLVTDRPAEAGAFLDRL